MGLGRCLFAVGILLAATPVAAKSYQAVSRPCRDVTLMFTQPGLVAAAPAKRGQTVRKGEVLVREDDSRLVLRKKLARVRAKSTLRIQAAAADLRQKQVELQRTQWAASKNAATAFEVQRAELAVTVDKLTVQLANLQHQRRELEYQLAKLEVARRKIICPFNGVVENRWVHVGEAAQAFTKAIRVVQIDPLKAFVPAPLATAWHLRQGQSARVVFPDGGVAAGTITWIAAVADAASGTLVVRVRFANPQHRPAGEEVEVNFPTTAARQTIKSTDYTDCHRFITTKHTKNAKSPEKLIDPIGTGREAGENLSGNGSAGH